MKAKGQFQALPIVTAIGITEEITRHTLKSKDQFEIHPQMMEIIKLVGLFIKMAVPLNWLTTY